MKRVALALALLPILAHVQSASPIATDRPSFSDGTLIIPIGHWQVEGGSTATTVSGTTSTTFGELLFRFPVSKRMEFRLSNVTWTHVTGLADGFQDPLVGVKFRLQDGSPKRLDLAGEIEATVPAGGADYRVGRSQPSGKFLWTLQTDSNTSIGGNIVASDLGPSGARFPQWAESLYISRTLNSATSVWAEAYRLDPIALDGPSGAFYDVGVAYLVNPRVQVDARFGAGFNQQRDGRSFGAGVAYRF